MNIKSSNVMSNILDEILTRLESVEEMLFKIIQSPMNEDGSDKFQYVNIEEAARMLDIAVPTLYLYTSKKRIRHYKKGNRLYFKMDDLNAFIEGGRVDPKLPRYR